VIIDRNDWAMLSHHDAITTAISIVIAHKLTFI
jgi:hypothetical protein